MLTGLSYNAARVTSSKISPHVYHLINIHVSFHLLYLLSRECVRHGVDGWSYVPTGGRCFTGMASVGDRAPITGSVVAVEGESGVKKVQ
jgi:hypothetical protein